MQRIIQKIQISRTSREVFDFTINPDNTPKWVAGVAKEQTNESPTKLGTIYKSQGQDGSWVEFVITDFEDGLMFELTKQDDSHHVKYALASLSDGSCELEYCVWVEEGEVSERFSPEAIKTILAKLKTTIETQ